MSTHEAGEQQPLRSALVEVLWESGRHGCMTDDCSDTSACPACQSDLRADVDAILAGFPDGWARYGGEWFRITSDGVGYGEFDRDTPYSGRST